MARTPSRPAAPASPAAALGTAGGIPGVQTIALDDPDDEGTDPRLAPDPVVDPTPARFLSAEELAAQPAFAQAIAIAMRAMGVGPGQPAPNGAVVAGIEPIGVKRGYVRIILEDKAEIPPTGQAVGYNGRAYLIQPGVPVDVPLAVTHILDDAVEDAPVIDEATRKPIGWRKRKRFPYQVLERSAA